MLFMMQGRFDNEQHNDNPYGKTHYFERYYHSKTSQSISIYNMPEGGQMITLRQRGYSYFKHDTLLIVFYGKLSQDLLAHDLNPFTVGRLDIDTH